MCKTLPNEISIKKYFLFFLFLIANSFAFSQYKKELTAVDKSCLEAVIVEKYYIATALDYVDTVGGAVPKGAITYRIYIDMKPGYKLQAVYGIASHKLKIETTTTFFNNTDRGEKTGDLIDDNKINENSVALDSWMTIGAAAKSYFGILKEEDKDGSILKRNSLLIEDGLKIGNPPKVAYFGVDLSFFNLKENAKSFITDNGSCAVFGGISGPTSNNRVLIAQLTTEGKISFELNIQIGTPSGGVVQYVAKNPEGSEILFDELNY